MLVGGDIGGSSRWWKALVIGGNSRWLWSSWGVLVVGGASCVEGGSSR